jgi:hypothetical protein
MKIHIAQVYQDRVALAEGLGGVAQALTEHLFLLVVVSSHAHLDALASFRLRNTDFFRSLFSLWILIFARPKTHRLKPAPMIFILKCVAPESRR